MSATVSCTCGWTAQFETVLAAATAPHRCTTAAPALASTETPTLPAPATPRPRAALAAHHRVPAVPPRRPWVALAGGTATGYPAGGLA